MWRSTPPLIGPHPWLATLDHIKSASLAGKHVLENRQAAHWICNVRQGDAWGRGRPPLGADDAKRR
ncbi:HNH endonuclease [Actinomadura sp. NPDC049382]